MKPILLIDFGSTYTKVMAVDLQDETVLGTAQASTTIENDVRIGLNEALLKLEAECGLKPEDYVEKYASSSAAGGLKMVSIGLVPSLTLEAAKRAALGAGAKVIGSYGFELDLEDIEEIEAKVCDIIMLAGGTDGGNKDVILHNAKMLAKSKIECPILVCGNSRVREDVAEILNSGKKQYYISSNVLPTVEEVNIEEAQEIIRNIFVKHITKAKGLDAAVKFIEREIIPIPKASLDAAELLAEGCEGEEGLGSLMIVEVGGATINIHSVEEVKAVNYQTVIRGLPEKKVKRTVEGDLGIRWNAHTIAEMLGEDVILKNLKEIEPQADIENFDLIEYTKYLNEHTEKIPTSKFEYDFDIALAMSAVDVAVHRHAGTLRKEVSVIGDVEVQYGKNLLEVRNIIGIGGIFKYGVEPERIFRKTTYTTSDPESLRPKSPRFFVDKTYFLYGIGLLSKDHPEAALRIAKKYLQRVEV